MKILFLNLPYEFNITRASRWFEKTSQVLCIVLTGWHTVLECVKLDECLGIDHILRQEYDYTVGELISSDVLSTVKGVSNRVNSDGVDIASLEDVNLLSGSINFEIRHTEDR